MRAPRRSMQLAGLALGLAACSRSAPEALGAHDAGVSWSTVRNTTRRTSLEAPAKVGGAPQAGAQLTVPFRATVKSIRARAGDSVDAGSVLLEVVMPEVLDAAARFDGARARLAAWTERAEQLTQLKTEGLARTLDVTEARARVAEAKADLQSARATLLAANVRDADVSAVLVGAGVTALRAPIAGVVTEVSVSLGEVKEPSHGSLMTLAGVGPIRIEARFSHPVPDGAFHFTANATSIELTCVNRAPIADAHDGTFVAWFEPVGTAVLAPGTLGRVTLEGTLEGAVTVPARALRRQADTTRVTTKRGEVAVDVLQCGASDCEVTGALAAGDDVLVGGAP